MKNKTKMILLWLIVLAAFITACGPAETDDEVAVINVDVSKLNGYTNKYTMISAQPAKKYEGNSAPTTTFDFTLSSASGTSGSYIAPLKSADLNKSLTNNKPVYGAGQIAIDNIMRKKENEILTNKKIQLSKKSLSSIYRAAPSNPTVDFTDWDVTVYNPNTDSFNPITVICRLITDHAYFYVDNRDNMSAHLANYDTAFNGLSNNGIYDKNHTYFGNESDVDTNGKIIIIFSSELAAGEPTIGLLGYFNPEDKFSKSTYSNSNEGDIIYLTTHNYPEDVIEATIAHEFQHMIYFDEHYERGVTSTYTWLNEALSQAAEYYNGYYGPSSNHIGWITNFLGHTNVYPNRLRDWEGLSLTYWTDNNYGYGAIFIRYLIDQYRDDAIYDMCSTNKVGIAAVEAATGEDFNTIFNNFTQALVKSDMLPITSPLSPYKFSSLTLSDLGSLTTLYNYNAGDSSQWWLYPYEIWFVDWTGTFASMTVTGNNIACTPIGYD
ncbi:MAG: hypothetical protein JXN64_10890 [Spirochaetes bacterium]|nr:hypothetical protein [Spirochaetota bacterium]